MKVWNGTAWVDASYSVAADEVFVGPDAPPTTYELWADTDAPDIIATPAGGLAGYVLTKKSATDYDSEWREPITSITTGINSVAIPNASTLLVTQNLGTTTFKRMVITTAAFLGSSTANAVMRAGLALNDVTQKQIQRNVPAGQTESIEISHAMLVPAGPCTIKIYGQNFAAANFTLIADTSFCLVTSVAFAHPG